MRSERFAIVALAAAMAQAQNGPPVIRTESRLVLVDAVVTDKSGAAIRGLTSKDFHVFEDGKEQPLQSASFVADATGPDAQRSYLVLFFDNATLDFASQQRAREAATQFIEANAAPTHSMAIVNYGGAISIAQNFTNDTDRLKRVVSEVSGGAAVERSNLDVNAPTMGSSSQSRAMATAGFGAEAFLLGLRQLAINLGSVPGRKSVVVFSAGFLSTPQLNVQITMAVQACNRSDIALYPVDVSGLAQPSGDVSMAERLDPKAQANAKNAQLHPTDIPTDTSASNQQVLYTMATATGGYVYANANNLATGLVKIGKDQSEYYLLGYAPTESPDGSCHPLKVKVDKGGVTVRARSTYCNVKAVDLLAGKPVEKELENRLAGDQPGGLAASMQAPYFFADADTARLNVALDIPSSSLQFEKAKGKSHAEVNILGIAYKADNSVGARFSDTVKLDFANQKEVEAFHTRPLHYEKQFLIAPGDYKLKVVFSSGGDNFGKVEAPLAIPAYHGKEFMLSGLALTKEIRPAAEMGSAQDAELLEGRLPLVFKEMRIVPAGGTRFSKSDTVAVYGEVYEPLLAAAEPPVVEVRMRIVDKAGAVKFTGAMRPEIVKNSGATMLPFAIKLKVDALTPGAYRTDIEAVDSAGKIMMHSVDFEIR